MVTYMWQLDTVGLHAMAPGNELLKKMSLLSVPVGHRPIGLWGCNLERDKVR